MTIETASRKLFDLIDLADANYVSHPGERFNAINNPAKPSGRRHGLRSTIAFEGSTFLLFFDSCPFFDCELLVRLSCESFGTFIEFGSCQWRLAIFGTVVGNGNEVSGVAFAKRVIGSKGITLRK